MSEIKHTLTPEEFVRSKHHSVTSLPVADLIREYNADLLAKVEELKRLLNEVLEYDKLTVMPRPPHPAYTIVSRIKKAIES